MTKINVPIAKQMRMAGCSIKEIATFFKMNEWCVSRRIAHTPCPVNHQKNSAIYRCRDEAFKEKCRGPRGKYKKRPRYSSESYGRIQTNEEAAHMSEQRSQEWFKEREDRVTASRVGAILGVDPNANPADVMRMMARQYQGAESEFPQGEFVDEVIFAYGRHHEKGAKIDYTMETGSIIKECGFTTFDNWLGASPDGEVGDEGLVEIKCPYGIRKGGDFKSINQLHHYYAQIQIQLYVTGRKWCDFYQWSQHGTKLEKVWMNQDYLDITLPKLKAFYNFYLTERDNLRYVDEKKRPEKNTPEARQLVAEHDDNNAAIKKLEERQKEILDNLVVMAGGKDASFDGRKLTKVERAGSIAYAKLVKDKLPNIDVEPYRGKSSEHWRLT